MSNMKLYKDKSREKICGVCAGIAEEFGWDVTLVRVIWALVALCYGTGLVAYIICAIVMPDKSEIDR
ncbi:MAG: PspC domain-containing protein [Inconstantimicrobium porci]|nr:PspC domain-containing protein [Inconstantimicrobium porci]MDD6771596.1 PspC domain-containing protein [Inconstantimicrobium porci]